MGGDFGSIVPNFSVRWDISGASHSGRVLGPTLRMGCKPAEILFDRGGNARVCRKRTYPEAAKPGSGDRVDIQLQD